MPLRKSVSNVHSTSRKMVFSHLLVTTANTVLWAMLRDLKESKEVLNKLFEKVKTLKSVLSCNPFIYKNTLFTVIRLRSSNLLFEY